MHAHISTYTRTYMHTHVYTCTYTSLVCLVIYSRYINTYTCLHYLPTCLYLCTSIVTDPSPPNRNQQQKS